MFITQHGSSEDGDFFLAKYTFAEIASTPFLQRGSIATGAERLQHTQILSATEAGPAWVLVPGK